MKKIISLIGIGAALLLAPSCKKSEVKPQESSYQSTQKDPRTMSTLFVSLSSRSCDGKQKEFSAVTMDIRTIKVFYENTGWRELTTNAGEVDLVRLQGAMEPANLTNHVTVPIGTISKVALVLGDRNRLVADGQTISCFKLSTKEVVIDMSGEVKASSLNQIMLGIDICGNIFAETSGNQTCYTLKPAMRVEAFRSMPSLTSPVEEEVMVP